MALDGNGRFAQSSSFVLGIGGGLVMVDGNGRFAHPSPSILGFGDGLAFCHVWKRDLHDYQPVGHVSLRDLVIVGGNGRFAHPSPSVLGVGGGLAFCHVWNVTYMITNP